MRHIWSALLILLRGNLCGGTDDYLSGSQACVGEKMFDDRDRSGYCRRRILANWNATTEPVCGGAVQGFYKGGPVPDAALFAKIKPLLNRIARQSNKPVVILQGFGTHFDYDVSKTRNWHKLLNAYLGKHRSLELTSIWAGPHGPNEKQPEAVRERQSPEAIRRFTKGLEEDVEREAEYAKVMDFFNATIGANHYDGVHLTYHANMEKAQLLLNYLALAHSETEQE